jgi:hypothetical protein
MTTTPWFGFKHSDKKDWQEQNPEDWKSKHEYGGNCYPICLEVFTMHGRARPLCHGKGRARPLCNGRSRVRLGGDQVCHQLGEYKLADSLDKKDPRCLHVKEVDLVKVVLCRFIKSLNGFAEAAKKNPQDVQKTPALSLKQANVRTAMINKALSKGLGDGSDRSDSKCTFTFVLLYSVFCNSVAQ